MAGSLPCPTAISLRLTPKIVVVIDERDISHTLSPLHIAFIEDAVDKK